MRVTREPVLLDGNSTRCGCSGFSPGPAKRSFPAAKSPFFYFPEAKALAEKQMNEMKAQIEGKCSVQ